MTVNKIEKIFDNESGSKTVILHNAPNSGNACSTIGLSVENGTVFVSGKVDKDSADMSLGMINLTSGDITTIASDGAYTVLGAETLYSVTFTADENAVATAKFVY